MGKKILVIEDHPDWRDLLSCYLGSLGYQTAEAENGLEGMEMAVRENPDLIILDLGLPDITGIEVALLLRACEKITSQANAPMRLSCHE